MLGGNRCGDELSGLVGPPTLLAAKLEVLQPTRPHNFREACLNIFEVSFGIAWTLYFFGQLVRWALS